MHAPKQVVIPGLGDDWAARKWTPDTLQSSEHAKAVLTTSQNKVYGKMELGKFVTHMRTGTS